MAARVATLALALLIATISVGCSRSGNDQYEQAMTEWLATITGDGGEPDPSLLLFDGPEPPDPPAAMAHAHRVFLTALRLKARTEMVREYHALYVGIAAAFCDPRDSGLVGQVAFQQIAALQLWRENSRSCVEGMRWAGNYPRPDDGWTRYEAPCSRDFSFDFEVLGSQLEWACADVQDARILLGEAESSWRSALDAGR